MGSFGAMRRSAKAYAGDILKDVSYYLLSIDV